MAVVGNEDGAHKVSADVFQGLNDVGFSPAPGAVTYSVGEAMQGTDYQDLDATPDAVTSTTAALVARRPPGPPARRRAATGSVTRMPEGDRPGGFQARGLFGSSSRMRPSSSRR